jgi:transposase
MNLRQREARRIEAVRRREAGESAEAIALDLGVGTNAVYQWTKQARLHGIDSLKLKPRSGRKLKLAKEHWDKLSEMVLAGPCECGFRTELWTLPLISELIQREFGVEYHPDHLSRFMRRLGFSRQKPTVRARERDEEAIETFVRVEFPRIEKKRGAAARS